MAESHNTNDQLTTTHHLNDNDEEHLQTEELDLEAEIAKLTAGHRQDVPNQFPLDLENADSHPEDRNHNQLDNLADMGDVDYTFDPFFSKDHEHKEQHEQDQSHLHDYQNNNEHDLHDEGNEADSLQNSMNALFATQNLPFPHQDELENAHNEDEEKDPHEALHAELQKDLSEGGTQDVTGAQNDINEAEHEYAIDPELSSIPPHEDYYDEAEFELLGKVTDLFNESELTTNKNDGTSDANNHNINLSDSAAEATARINDALLLAAEIGDVDIVAERMNSIIHPDKSEHEHELEQRDDDDEYGYDIIDNNNNLTTLERLGKHGDIAAILGVNDHENVLSEHSEIDPHLSQNDLNFRKKKQNNRKKPKGKETMMNIADTLAQSRSVIDKNRSYSSSRSYDDTSRNHNDQLKYYHSPYHPRFNGYRTPQQVTQQTKFRLDKPSINNYNNRKTQLKSSSLSDNSKQGLSSSTTILQDSQSNDNNNKLMSALALAKQLNQSSEGSANISPENVAAIQSILEKLIAYNQTNNNKSISTSRESIIIQDRPKSLSTIPSSSSTSASQNETKDNKALVTEKTRISNRERKKKWREENDEKNKDNDLRCRVHKRATLVFGENDTEEKLKWIEEEFTKRKEKRINRLKKNEYISQIYNMNNNLHIHNNMINGNNNSSNDSNNNANMNKSNSSISSSYGIADVQRSLASVMESIVKDSNIMKSLGNVSANPGDNQELIKSITTLVTATIFDQQQSQQNLVNSADAGAIPTFQVITSNGGMNDHSNMDTSLLVNQRMPDYPTLAPDKALTSFVRAGRQSHSRASSVTMTSYNHRHHDTNISHDNVRQLLSFNSSIKSETPNENISSNSGSNNKYKHSNSIVDGSRKRSLEIDDSNGHSNGIKKSHSQDSDTIVKNIQKLNDHELQKSIPSNMNILSNSSIRPPQYKAKAKSKPITITESNSNSNSASTPIIIDSKDVIMTDVEVCSKEKEDGVIEIKKEKSASLSVSAPPVAAQVSTQALESPNKKSLTPKLSSPLSINSDNNISETSTNELGPNHKLNSTPSSGSHSMIPKIQPTLNTISSHIQSSPYLNRGRIGVKSSQTGGTDVLFNFNNIIKRPTFSKKR